MLKHVRGTSSIRNTPSLMGAASFAQRVAQSAAKRAAQSARFAAFALVLPVSMFAFLPQSDAAAASGTSSPGDGVLFSPNETAGAFAQTPAIRPRAPIILAQAAAAPQRGENIEDRASRRFKAEGTRSGSFLVFPSVGVTAQWDDNIFSTNTNEVDDYVTLINPALQLQSDWNNHALNFSADAEIARFSDRGREDYVDYSVGFDSRMDVRRSTNITAGAAFGAQREERSSPDDVGGLEPTDIAVTTAQIGFFHGFNRVSIGLDGSARRLDFDDARTAAGAVLNNDDRDRTEYDASVRVGVEISPTTEAQVVGSYNQSKYELSLDDLGLNRDSDGYALQGGLVFDVTGSVMVDFLVGVFTQSFDDVTLADVDGSTFQLGVNWNVTALTTLTAAVSRSIEETTLAATSGVLRTSAALGIDHELLRNVIISADVSSVTEDFRGITRDDQTVDFRAGAQYLIHPRLVAEFGVNVTTRDSDVAAQDFDRNRYFFRLVGRL